MIPKIQVSGNVEMIIFTLFIIVEDSIGINFTFPTNSKIEGEKIKTKKHIEFFSVLRYEQPHSIIHSQIIQIERTCSGVSQRCWLLF